MAGVVALRGRNEEHISKCANGRRRGNGGMAYLVVSDELDFVNFVERDVGVEDSFDSGVNGVNELRSVGTVDLNRSDASEEEQEAINVKRNNVRLRILLRGI